MLRLALIDNNDSCHDAAATALVQGFEEPLADIDMDGIAVLTRIGRDTLHRAAATAAQAFAPSVAATTH